MAGDLTEIEQRLTAAMIACGEDAEAAGFWMEYIRLTVEAGTFDEKAFEESLKTLWKVGARNRTGSTWMGTAIAALERKPTLETLSEYQEILTPDEFAELRQMFDHLQGGA